MEYHGGLCLASRRGEISGTHRSKPLFKASSCMNGVAETPADRAGVLRSTDMVDPALPLDDTVEKWWLQEVRESKFCICMVEFIKAVSLLRIDQVNRE